MSYPAPPPYPQQQPSGPLGKQRLRGRTPLRLSIIFFVVAVLLFVVGGIVLANKSFSKVNGFERVKLASSGSVQLNRTGNYVAYYEADNVDSGTRSVPRIPIAIQSPSGKIQQLNTPYGNRSDGKVKIITYQYNGHNGIALYQFKISEKGTYKVQVGSNTAAASGADMAFGESIAGGTAAGALLVVGGGLFLITAIVLLIVGLVKRSRHKKELQYGYQPGGPPQGGQQWPQQPPPGQPGGYPQQA